MQRSTVFRFTTAVALMFTTAAVAAATQVNIADPKNANRAARVEIGNRLAVQEVPPSAYFHSGGFLTGGSPCVTFATAPVNKAVVVRQIRVDVTDTGTAGQNTITFFFGSVCNEVVGQATPSSVGPLTVTFDPGLVLNPGAPLAASGSPKAALYLDGYLVDSAAASRVAP